LQDGGTLEAATHFSEGHEAGEGHEGGEEDEGHEGQKTQGRRGHSCLIMESILVPTFYTIVQTFLWGGNSF